MTDAESMKAYLDNNVVSAIAKDDTAAESDALDRLLAARDAGKVELVTSELTLDEIKRYTGPARKQVERTFRLLEKVPVVRWDELLGMHSYGDARTWITSPLIQNNPLYDSLLGLGVNRRENDRRSTRIRVGEAVLRSVPHLRLRSTCPRRWHQEAVWRRGSKAVSRRPKRGMVERLTRRITSGCTRRRRVARAPLTGAGEPDR